MRDQAEKLRLKMENPKLARSIAVVSGKGGVGKSNFSTNFSYNLSKRGARVLIMDMDIGMGNVHILLGESTQHALSDYLLGNCGLEQLVKSYLPNLDYISGGSAMTSILDWNDLMLSRLLNAFETLQNAYDYIVFDMGAGATEWTLQLIEAIDDIIVVTTTEPTAIMDGYSMVKYIHMNCKDKNMYIVVNRSLTLEDGKFALKRIKNTAFHFLQENLKILGAIPEDMNVRKAVQQQKIFSVLYEKTAATKALQDIVETYVLGQEKTTDDLTMQSNKFMGTLKSMFNKGRR